jgi:carboxylesterase type B
MSFALEWVQKHISKFGGDERKVTIAGESAGGGAVTLLGIAKGGSLGTTQFLNVSP